MPLVGFLATLDGSEALELAPTELAASSCSVQGLRKVFLERTALDAYILHTDGLELAGQTRSFTVRLELASPFSTRSTDYPPLPRARPWQEPGWVRASRVWSEGALGERLVTLEQVSTSDLGTVLRLETSSRTAYLKTSERRLEATLTAHIAHTHPDLTPPVGAWDADGNLLLTEDCGTRLSETADPTLWRSAVVKLARFQRTADGAALRRLGCPVHPFDDLADRASRFLKNDKVLGDWGMNPKQIARLQDYLPAILAAHGRVARLELPLLPAHGDAHPMNVLTDCNVVFFDWSDTCLAHPLLDIGWFLAWTQHPGRATLPLHQHQQDAASLLWRTYLTAAGYVVSASLWEAMLLALIHRVLVYHERYHAWQGTLRGWRPQYVPFLLRSLLKLAL